MRKKNKAEENIILEKNVNTSGPFKAEDTKTVEFEYHALHLPPEGVHVERPPDHLGMPVIITFKLGYNETEPHAYLVHLPFEPITQLSELPTKALLVELDRRFPKEDTDETEG